MKEAPLLNTAEQRATQQPATTDERVFQLFGLDGSGYSRNRWTGFVEALIRPQRPDGGWAQLTGRESDAYAMGSVLVALHQSGRDGHRSSGLPAGGWGTHFGVEEFPKRELSAGTGVPNGLE